MRACAISGRRIVRLLDRGLVLWFPAPASFTGEDIAELQLHGSRAVIGALIEAVLSLRGHAARRARRVRPPRLRERQARSSPRSRALPTSSRPRREAQRAQALRQPGGFASALYEVWRQSLLRAAGADRGRARLCRRRRCRRRHRASRPRRVAGLLADMSHLLDGQRGERLRDGFRIVIAGPPNAGKSSLLNALAQARRRDRVGGGGHHARRHRGPSRPRRLAGDPHRHRGHTRGGRRGRGRGRAARACAGRRGRPRAVARRRHRAAWEPPVRDIKAEPCVIAY